MLKSTVLFCHIYFDMDTEQQKNEFEKCIYGDNLNFGNLTLLHKYNYEMYTDICNRIQKSNEIIANIKYNNLHGNISFEERNILINKENKNREEILRDIEKHNEIKDSCKRMEEILIWPF